MPSKPNRQLSRLDLSTYDTDALHAIEVVANSAPYLGNEVLRNDLILDTELRSSNILTHFFIGGGVAELEPGVNLLRNGRAWGRVSNEVFFNAIRMAWNNYHLVVEPNAMGSSSAEPTVRNADVVWLENWTPVARLNQGNVMELSFSIAEVWNIRARAQKLNQLLKWKEEGAVVERWAENCAMCREPSRQALGRDTLRRCGTQSWNARMPLRRVSPISLTNGSPQYGLIPIGSIAMTDPSVSPWT
jgi:hypothetical protein